MWINLNDFDAFDHKQILLRKNIDKVCQCLFSTNVIILLVNPEIQYHYLTSKSRYLLYK